MNEIKLEVNLQSKKRLTRWNIFIFTFLLVFFLTVIQKINPDFKNLSLVSPIPAQNQTFKEILPKLQSVPNDFKLKKESSIIETTFASSAFDNASSYIAVDFDTGTVIAEKNISKPLPIASLTKIMTAVVALDLAKSQEQIVISRNATNEEPTKIGVVENQTMTVEELLSAMLMTSANDAAAALKDGVNNKYKSPIFIDSMNKKASIIGLKNTNFSNPQGFDNSKNYSSTEDLAILTRYALKNYSTIKNIVDKDYRFIAANNNHKQFDLYNWNGLLGVYPGVSGVKIGNTDEAGYTTVVMSERNGKKIIVVLLGTPGVLERDLWASQLLDFAFQKSANLVPVSVSEVSLRQKYSTWKYWN
ncbi:MAG TPA: D-alanyl-D-alanine carboxypeptidase family protein [Patescibacteria group bacterium]|nr:D-alanyl-D-alanine carboxypeptidase family protein [Patescibacteria group bacterium]